MQNISPIRWLPVVALLPVIALGQLDRSTLNGTVTDPRGARVPGALVTAIQLDTGLERRTQTSSQGTYALDGLPTGRYTITVSKSGFADLRFEQVDQGVGQTRTLDAQLRLTGTAGGSTTVLEPVVRLDTTSAVLGAPIEQAQLRDLPLNGRNWSSL